jgi:hypothetical protein
MAWWRGDLPYLCFAWVTWGLVVNPSEVMPSPGGPARFMPFFTCNIEHSPNLIKQMARIIIMSFQIYRLYQGENTYIGRTVDFNRRMMEHEEVKGDFTPELLATYPDIKVTGWGRLAPRMEYLWFKRLNPNLNKVVPGHYYYLRDCEKYPDPLVDYERFDREHRIAA